MVYRFSNIYFSVFFGKSVGFDLRYEIICVG